jgi:hypothetical protein
MQRPEITVTWEDIEEMMTALISFNVQRVKRSGNSVGHLCAQFASSSIPSSMWCDQPPSFLLPSLLRKKL